MCAPLRPGETLKKIHLQGESWFNQVVQPDSAPISYVEVGIWKVPLSTLGQAFVDLVVASAEDARDLAGIPSSVLSGSGVVFHPGGSADAGHLTPGLQNRNRPWAGEIGPTDATDAEASYMPYTSFGTYAIANTWYEMEIASNTPGEGRLDEDLFEFPPSVGDYVRGATLQGITQSSEPDLGPNATGSLTSLAERLSLLTKTSRTYAEYLAGFGIDPKRVQSIPLPLLVQQHVLKPKSTGTLVHSLETDVTGQATHSTNDDLSTFSGTFNGAVGPTTGLLSDQRPVAMIGTEWDAMVLNDVPILEPSVVIGTVVAWANESKETEFAHVMDATRMVSGAHWGDPSFGGVEEQEFLTAQRIFEQDGTDVVPAGEDGETGVRAINLLNLFVHGDTFSNDVEGFRYRGPLGSRVIGTNFNLKHKMSVRMDIASDLLGG